MKTQKVKLPSVFFLFCSARLVFAREKENLEFRKASADIIMKKELKIRHDHDKMRSEERRVGKEC